MLKKLASLFQKKKVKAENTEENTISTAAIILHVGIDGEMYLDVQMRDTEEETVEDLVELLKYFSPVGFVQINNVMKASTEQELHAKIISRFVEEVGVDYFSEAISPEVNEQPCISPSDML